MIKRTLATVLILLTVLPAFILAGSVLFAPYNSLEEFDAALESSVNAALGKGSETSKPMQPLPDGGRFIVKFKDDASLTAVTNALESCEYRQLAESGERLFAISDADGKFIEEHKELIEYHEEDLVREVLAVTNDAVTLPAYETTGIYGAWDSVRAKNDIIVAVLDTGVDRTHEDLADASILPGYDAVTKTAGVYDDAVGHGTGIIGLIAATADNGIGIAGAAHGVTVLPIKVSSSSTTIYSSDLVAAIRFAANSGAKIINMSIGGLSYSYAEEEAVNYAVSKGCILVSASGNGGLLPYADKKSYPASYEGVISVASCDANGERSAFSQYNDMVDVAAPGEAVIIPVVENGISAYRTDSGTSYSCAMVSAIAALAVSACDEGVRFDSDEFLSLIMNTCGSVRTDELGFGIINAMPITESANLPIITGVTDGSIYNESIRIGFNRGSAMLDGEPFEDGDAIIANGDHELKITDGDFEKTIRFRLEYEPFSYEFKEFSDYAYFKFNRGSALLDGFPYSSGERITASGRHEFVITDGTQTFRKTVYISYSLPSVYGVEDGGVYNNPIEICVVGDGKAMLDGKRFYNRIAVAESGVHTLTVESGNGAVKKDYSFEINFPYAEFTQTDYAESTAAVDEENGYVCIYGDSLVGVRIYGLDDLSQYLHFLPVGRVYAHKFTETELILAGDEGLTVISRANALDPEAAVIGRNYLEGIDLYTFADEKTYCFGERNIYLLDEALSELTPIARTEHNVSEAFYSDGIICLIPDTYDSSVYLFNTENSSVSRHTFDFSLDSQPIYFEQGKLFVGNRLIDVQSESTVLEFASYKAIDVENGLLFCENGIIDISTGNELARFPFLVSDVVWGVDSVYLFGLDPMTAKISKLAEDVFAYGAAKPTDLAFSQPEITNDFRQTLFIDEGCGALSAVSGENNIFAVFKDKHAIYSLSLDTLAENTPTHLRFAPEKLFLSGGYLAVAFENASYVYIAPETDISAGAYIKLPSECDSACTVNGVLYAVSGGRLLYCRADGSETAVLSVRAQSVATDGTRIYVQNGTTLTAYGENLVRLAEIKTAEGKLFVGNGVIVGNLLYDNALFAEYAAIANPIDQVYGSVYFSGNGIYDILTSRYIGGLGVESPDAVCASPNGTFVAFDGSTVTVSKHSEEHDISTPPTVEGISDGGIYKDGATVTFAEGVGYIDGNKILSGATVTEAGAHIFVLALPFGQSVSVKFTVEARIEKIEFLVPDRTMSVGETINLRMRFLPDGASSVPVSYSCDSDGLKLGEMGELTALRTGVYTVTATVVTDYGTFSAENTITVRDDLITFKEGSGISIDRDGLYLYGIEPGSKAADILSLLSVEKEARILDTSKREIKGVIATGHTLVLYGDKGEITDSLTVVIRGDTDGDGFITAYDMLTLERMLKNYQYDSVYLKAGDINGNGVLADNDFRALRNTILRRNEEIIGKPDKNLFGSVDVQTLSVIESGEMIDLVLCLNGVKHARSINGIVEYGSGLEFVESETTGWDGDCRDIGDNRLALFAYDHKGEECGKAFFVIISLRFRVTASVGETVRLTARELTASFKDGAKQITFNDGKFKVSEKRAGDFRIDILNAKAFEFDPDVYEYDGITIPYNAAVADIAITHDGSSTVTVSGAAVPNDGKATITVSRITEDGKTNVYTLNVRRESEPRFDSNCRLDSLEVEGFRLIPAFDPEITEYSISVPFGTEKISVHCKAQNPTAQVLIGDTALYSENNTVTVTVISPDGESLVYTIYATVLPKVDQPSEPPLPEPEDEGIPIWMIITFSALALVPMLIAVWLTLKRKKQNKK